MGTWGHGIRQDDFVCDVIGVFEDLLKSGSSISDATKAIKEKFENEIKDTDDAPLFWIAIADVRWTYGGLEPQVLRRVQEDFNSERGLDRWRDDERMLSQRRTAMGKFIAKISKANPRPKKPPKIVSRAPKFRLGDCLSIRLTKGQFAAAVVLAADHSNVEYGRNLIGVLDYLSEEKPNIDVFRKRRWLVRTHHSWNGQLDIAWYLPLGFRAAKDQIEIVGQVDTLESDPKDSNCYGGWAGIGEQAELQREWDAKTT